MSDTTDITTATAAQIPIEPSASIVPVEGGNLELSAQSPDEIVQCHAAIIQWCKRKIEVIRGEANELVAAAEHAKKQKWKSGTLDKHAKLAEKRVTFYSKMLTALEAGYHIIPPMPVELFAIRTKRSTPEQKYQVVRYINHANFEQDAQILPEGEGEYQNPQPVTIHENTPHKVQEGNQTVEKYSCWADRWADIEFPANMARIHVMQATTRAMAIKVFDDLGMLPTDRKRNPDPMIIGRIYDPRLIGYGPKKSVSFLIAWHIDTRIL